MILLVDWGNSFLKCVRLEKSRLASPEVFNQDSRLECYSAVDALEPVLSGVTLVYVCSVRSEADNRVLFNLLGRHAIPCHFLTTQKQSCGVVCGYKDYRQLGTDRWMAIIAASDIARRAKVNRFGVIDAGSAITLDLVVADKHLGGHILPGRKLMFDGLYATGKVRPAWQEPAATKTLLGSSTDECVSLAIDMAIKGYLLQVINVSEQQFGKIFWLMTGGGSRELADYLASQGHAIAVYPELVFKGMQCLINESQARAD